MLHSHSFHRGRANRPSRSAPATGRDAGNVAVCHALIQFRASVGIATDSFEVTNWHELVDRANANLLDANVAGRGRHSDGRRVRADSSV